MYDQRSPWKIDGGTREFYRTIVHFINGGRLLTNRSTGPIEIWDIEKGKLIHTISGLVSHCRIWQICCSPNNEQIAVAGKQRIYICYIEPGKLKHVLKEHMSSLEAICYSPNGRQLASGELNGTVRIYDTEMGQLVHTLMGHDGCIREICYSLDSEQLASAGPGLENGNAEVINIWNAKNGVLIRTLQRHDAPINDICYSPINNQLMSVVYNVELEIWNLQTGTLIYTKSFYSHHMKKILYSPDGRQIILYGTSGCILILNAETGTIIHTLAREECIKIYDVYCVPRNMKLLERLKQYIK